MARRHASNEEETEINITPMLDIVFIMLIFFIVSTSFVKDTGIDPRRPQADTAVKQDLANILVAVAPDGVIWMEKKPVELGAVRAMIERARAENPASSVVIVADEQADSGIVLDLMDQAGAAGVTSISLAARPARE